MRPPESEQPAVHHLSDAVALPNLPGLYDLSGRRIDVAAHQTISPRAAEIRRRKVYEKLPELIKLPPDLDVVEGPILLGGCLFKHYGHYLIDSMSRLWARHRFPSLPILFTKDRKWKTPPAYSHEILGRLGLLSRVFWVDRPTLFRQVFCPGTAFEYRSKVYSDADEPHRRVADAAGVTGDGRWSRPVYLTRSGLRDEQVRSAAEPELEQQLSGRGVEIVRPETLPLADQIALFEQAPAVIGTTGSALHTVLFSRRSGSRLAILSSGRGLENYLMIDCLKQNNTHYLKCIERRTEEGEHVLDVQLALSLLERSGFLDIS